MHDLAECQPPTALAGVGKSVRPRLLNAPLAQSLPLQTLVQVSRLEPLISLSPTGVSEAAGLLASFSTQASLFGQALTANLPMPSLASCKLARTKGERQDSQVSFILSKTIETLERIFYTKSHVFEYQAVVQ